jgi:uncharacterized protein YndB with AHSA1/START domain
MTVINEFATEGSFDQEVSLAREFYAKVEDVFKAWTQPSQLAKWWGPKHFTNPRCQLDPRTGGGIRIDMRAPDGTVYPMSGIFREVVNNERLVFTSAALDNKENALFEVLNTITFADNNGKTKLNVLAIVLKVFQPTTYLQGMEAGWRESLDRLESLLSEPKET